MLRAAKLDWGLVKENGEKELAVVHVEKEEKDGNKLAMWEVLEAVAVYRPFVKWWWGSRIASGARSLNCSSFIHFHFVFNPTMCSPFSA